ncbi:threonine/serine exporter family protein [Aggregicoccus sp. 17bor-14]|nr:MULTISPECIES: threonine/serine exporter family protein [Myxococcaceae]MBF5043890.1 threonine/serine exporter family protein [Simulacricoccus sp. 17bor-14]MRI89641.1 threonine/serine exporter family protein [Aggregicoccus sp. 17bor-14]
MPAPASAVAFTIKLGRALHHYGMPAHRLEEAMRLVSERLGLEARFFSSPTSIIASFGPPEALQTALIRVDPGEMDLGKLVRLDTLADEVILGTRTPEDGSQRVEEILAAPQAYGPFLLLLCWALAAFAGARLFGGGLMEMSVSGFASLLIGGLDLLSRSRPAVARVLVPVSALLASTIAVVAGALVGPLAGKVVTLASLIVLLPGLTLTVAMTEMATRNLLSGTSRMMSAALVFLQLGFGVALGSRLQVLLPPVQSPLPGPLAHWTELAALAGLALSVCVIFNARRRDAGWILLAGALAYVGTRFGAYLLGPELGAFVGAVILGMASNAVSTLRNKPALVTIVPGLMLLVPGSIGFRSLSSLLERNVVAGVDTAFNMLMVAVALAAGLLVANAIVPARKVL